MLPTCAKCGRDTLRHRSRRLRHAFVSKDDTARELKSHVDHVVVALEANNLEKAEFHLRNAQGCLNELKQKVNRVVDYRACDDGVPGCCCNQTSNIGR